MSDNLKAPHILLASGNVEEMPRNIEPIIGAKAAKKLRDEVKRNVAALVRLGLEHLEFAK